MSNYNSAYTGPQIDAAVGLASKHASRHATGGADAITPAAIGAMASTAKPTPAAHASTHGSAGTDPITPADIGAAGRSALSAATLLAASWTGTEAPFSYALAVTGATADNVVEVFPGASITAEQLEVLQGANMQDGGQAAGSITIQSFGDKPGIDLPIRVIVRGDI